MFHIESHTISYLRDPGMTGESRQGTDTPGVVMRPPRLYLAALAIGIAADAMMPGGSAFPAWLSFFVGALLMVGGVAIMALSMRGFSRAGTNVPTNRPATALVTTGLHRHSRNPIYVALTMIYAGIALAASSPTALVLLLPVLLIMRYGVIAREERYLAAKFGGDYRAYCACTRRWL